MPTLLAVDGNSLFHRAYHAYSPRDTITATLDKKGRNAWGTLGFLMLLGGLIERVKPDAILIGFDDKEASKRRALYPQYKAGRATQEDSLTEQLERTIKITRDLGLSVVIAPGLEADDVIASGADQAPESWVNVIATSDRDSFALINERTVVLRLVNGGLKGAVRVTPEVLEEITGVKAGQYLDYAALRGDKSDNLPGVGGFGEKTAAKLLNAFESVDAALAAFATDPESLAEILGKTALGKLTSAQGQRDFFLTRDLMKLDTKIDLGDTFTRGPRFDEEELAAVFAKNHIMPVSKLVRMIAKQPQKRISEVENMLRAEAFTQSGTLQDETPPLEKKEETQTCTSSEAQTRAFLIPNPRPEKSLLTTG